MSETISSAQNSARTADSAKAERLRFSLVTGGIVCALVVAVLILRFHRLNEIPQGLPNDAGLDGVLALQVLQGKHAVFFPVSNGREASAIYAIALSTALLGRTLLAMHLPTALGSAGMVFVVFWLGRLLFGRDESGRATPWRGLLIAGVGAGLLAASLSQTVIGRSAYNKVTHMSLLLSLCLALLWRGWQERSLWRIALAGVCAGLLPYTYIPARFTPFLFLFFGLSFLLPFRSVTRERMRVELPWVGIFLGVAGLVAAPILVYFALHPEHFFMRSSEISVATPHRSQGDPLGTFLVNVWEHLLAFGFRGDPRWGSNFAGQPMLNPWEAFFFWLGVGMALWGWQRRPAYRLLLLWLGVLILPAMLAIDDGAPNFLRMMGAAPAIYLLVAVGMWEAFRFLKERCRALPGRANLIFQENNTRSAIALGALVGGLILVQGVITYRTVFQQWANAPELNEAYHTEMTDLAWALNAQPSAADMVYLIPSFRRLYSFEYLYLGTAPTHVFPAYLIHTNMTYLQKELESTLAAMENVSIVKVVEWKTINRLINDDTDLFDFLLKKYGRYLGSDEYAGFRVHNYVDISLDRTWTYYEQLEPLTVVYDGGIALQGLALGQGEEQLPSRQRLTLGQDRSLWGVLQWQTGPGLKIDYAISLRLYNAKGERAYQADDLLWKPTTHTPTSQWSADELVDSLFWVEFPADIPPGDYELRMVVYNFETQVPTVEVGVWEPEFVLARLLLSDGATSQR